MSDFVAEEQRRWEQMAAVQQERGERKRVGVPIDPGGNSTGSGRDRSPGIVEAEACSEEMKPEKKVKEQCEKILAEKLDEIMATTSVVGVWKSFEKVRERWEMEAMAVASQRENEKDINEQEDRRGEMREGLETQS